MQQPHMSFDPGTFMFCMGLFGFLMAGISYSSAKTFPAHVRGIKEWSFAMVALGLSFFLFFMRGALPSTPTFFTYLLANELALAIPAFNLLGISRFLDEKKAPIPLIAGLCAVGGVGAALAYFGVFSLIMLVFFVSLPAGLMYAVLSWKVYHSNLRRVGASWLVMAASGIMAAALVQRAIKVITGDGSSANLFAHSDTQLLFFIAGGVAIIASSMGLILLAHERLRREIKEASLRDGLTGLYTRAAFFEQAAVLDQSRDADSPAYSVVMVDIDRFKSINDTYGHFCGDVALIRAAKIIAATLGPSDIAARYGGEEFCVLLRNSGAEEAQKFSNRLVENVRQNTVELPSGVTISFTVSAGYAWRPDPRLECQVSIKELLERADTALYEAKRGGRDQARAI